MIDSCERQLQLGHRLRTSVWEVLCSLNCSFHNKDWPCDWSFLDFNLLKSNHPGWNPMSACLLSAEVQVFFYYLDGGKRKDDINSWTITFCRLCMKLKLNIGKVSLMFWTLTLHSQWGRLFWLNEAASMRPSAAIVLNRKYPVFFLPRYCLLF